eukprot:6857449-Pyramimonas_sp.AAC.1
MEPTTTRRNFGNLECVFSASFSLEQRRGAALPWNRTGDGATDYDEAEILHLTRYFTLLMRAPTGHIAETHQDFIIVGQTEHTL